ncbi:MAG: hypothetical protein U0165_12605 [Polyangiaceae bacterium]
MLTISSKQLRTHRAVVALFAVLFSFVSAGCSGDDGSTTASDLSNVTPVDQPDGGTSTSNEPDQGGDPSGPIACTSRAACPADDACATWACTSGVCTATALNEGKAIDDPSQGDCSRIVCKQGHAVAAFDANDAPSDNNECTQDRCTENGVTHTPVALGTTCNNNDSAGLCNASGACVACLVDADCGADATCSQGQCFSSDDGIKNGTETDIDCGGTSNQTCGDAKQCLQHSDCYSGLCESGICVGCTDGVTNGGEGDIDCGGTCEQKCNVTQHCNVGADCASGVCTDNACAAPRCDDGVQNRLETDIDCGGTTGCPRCPMGKRCEVNADCTSSLCSNGTCE